MKNEIYSLSISCTKILYAGCHIILAYLFYLIIAITSHTDTAKNVILHTYLPQFHNIVATLCIFVIGAIIFDITEKEMEIFNH